MSLDRIQNEMEESDGVRLVKDRCFQLMELNNEDLQLIDVDPNEVTNEDFKEIGECVTEILLENGAFGEALRYACAELGIISTSRTLGELTGG